MYLLDRRLVADPFQQVSVKVPRPDQRQQLGFVVGLEGEPGVSDHPGDAREQPHPGDEHRAAGAGHPAEFGDGRLALAGTKHV